MAKAQRVLRIVLVTVVAFSLSFGVACSSANPIVSSGVASTTEGGGVSAQESPAVVGGIIRANTAITPVMPGPSIAITEGEPMPEPVPAGPEKRLVYSNIPNFLPDELATVPGDLQQIKSMVSDMKGVISERTIVVEKPVEVVVEKEVERIVEVPVEKIVEVEKTVEVIVEKEVEKIVEVEKPVEVIVEKQVEVIVEKIIEKPVEVIVEKVVERPVEVVVEKPVEVIVEKVVEREVEKIVEVEKPVEVIVEKIVDREVEKIVEVPVEVVVEKQVEVVVEKIVEKPVEVVVEKEVEKIVDRALSPPELMDRVDAYVSGEIAARTGGVRPFVAKAGLPLFGRAASFSDEDLSALTEADREMLLGYQTFFANISRQLGAMDQGADRAVLSDAANQLADSINALKTISISQAWLCRAVSGYGSFMPFDVYEFRQGDLPNILVYTELEHYRSERQSDGQYVVRLVQELSLVKERAFGRDKPVWSEQPVEISDVSRNARRDFFLVQYLRLPEKLDAGDYILQIKVTDQATGGSSTKSIPLRIVSK